MHDEVPSEWCLTFSPFFSGCVPVGTPATSRPLDAQRAPVPLIRAYTRRTVLRGHPHYELAFDVNFQFSLHCRERAHRIDVCIAERRDHRKGEAILVGVGFSRNSLTGSAWGLSGSARPAIPAPPDQSLGIFPARNRVHKQLAIPYLPSSQFAILALRYRIFHLKLITLEQLVASSFRRGRGSCPTHALESCWKSNTSNTAQASVS